MILPLAFFVQRKRGGAFAFSFINRGKFFHCFVFLSSVAGGSIDVSGVSIDVSIVSIYVSSVAIGVSGPPIDVSKNSLTQSNRMQNKNRISSKPGGPVFLIKQSLQIKRRISFPIFPRNSELKDFRLGRFAVEAELEFDGVNEADVIDRKSIRVAEAAE